MWQVYVTLNRKYGWYDYWCKQNVTSEAEIQILKLQDIKSKDP